MKPRIVVSGVNLIEFGPLSVFKDALRTLAAHYSSEYEIVVLVHRNDLFDLPGVKYLEYPAIKSSWLRRIWLEYFGLKRLSRELHPYLWLSMHDMSANVDAEVRAVYCHNPSPFLRLKPSAWLHSPKFSLYTLLYRYLYKINIRKNDWVIVQQDWIRETFRNMYKVERVIVAHPVSQPPSTPPRTENQEKVSPAYCFFYPCYPRVFKNIEVVLRAAELLEQRGLAPFEIWLTIDGSENRYSASLVRRFAGLKSVEFLGLLSRDQVFERYRQADCMLFPSLLETWGMPITEFQSFSKPMLLADLPYAHETVGDYRYAAFFSPKDEVQLAAKMQAAIEHKPVFGPVSAAPVDPPYCGSWEELFAFLLRGATTRASNLTSEPSSYLAVKS